MCIARMAKHEAAKWVEREQSLSCTLHTYTILINYLIGVVVAQFHNRLSSMFKHNSQYHHMNVQATLLKHICVWNIICWISQSSPNSAKIRQLQPDRWSVALPLSLAETPCSEYCCQLPRDIVSLSPASAMAKMSEPSTAKTRSLQLHRSSRWLLQGLYVVSTHHLIVLWPRNTTAQWRDNINPHMTRCFHHKFTSSESWSTGLLAKVLVVWISTVFGSTALAWGSYLAWHTIAWQHSHFMAQITSQELLSTLDRL